MTHRVERFGLQVSAPLHDLIEEALPGTGVSADAFWQGFDMRICALGISFLDAQKKYGV